MRNSREKIVIHLVSAGLTTISGSDKNMSYTYIGGGETERFKIDILTRYLSIDLILIIILGSILLILGLLIKRFKFNRVKESKLI